MHGYYGEARIGGTYGSLQPLVNCYDQAAAVQVYGTFSTGEQPSWLFQSTTGYVKTFNLVGIGYCNNPFFRIYNTPQIININNVNRSGFANHAFNGSNRIYNSGSDFIYDATGGPQTGTLHPQQFLKALIDTATTLYGRNPSMARPGTLGDIVKCPGVTSRSFCPDDSGIGEHKEKLLSRCSASNAMSYSQVHWDDVLHWVKAVFGDSCDIAFQYTHMEEGFSDSLWHLAGVKGADDDIVLRVKIVTRVGDDGNLDYTQSSRAAFNHLAFTLTNLQLDLGPDDVDLGTLWAPASFTEYAQCSVQHAAHIPTGRILLTCGNVFIDICGGSSSATLEPLVLGLLNHTTVTAPVSLHIPSVTHFSYEIPQVYKGLVNQVKGRFSFFDVKCHVDSIIAVASAHVEGGGLLLNRYDIEVNEVDNTSTVTFKLMTRTIGTHDVELYFGKALTMSTGTKRIQITVVD